MRNNRNGTTVKTKAGKRHKQQANVKPNARVDIMKLYECVLVFVCSCYVVVFMPQSLFSTFPMQQQRHARNASNFCCCLIAVLLGFVWARVSVQKDKRVFNYSYCHSVGRPFRYLRHLAGYCTVLPSL